MTVEQAQRHDGDCRPASASIDDSRRRPPPGSADQRRWRRHAIIGIALGVTLGALVVTLRTDLVPPLSTHADPDLRPGYIANPGMGWQDTRRAEPRFEQTVEYVRPTGGWAALNPAPGVYEWTILDEALADAAGRGNLLGLRIYTMRSPRSDGHRVPEWVIEQGATLTDGEPDYSNAVYQDRWATFVEALRVRYDGDPRIAFIDISGYGNYNEWSWQDQTRWDADWRAPTSLDGQARRRLADLFLGGAGTVEVRGADGSTTTVPYRYRGFRETQLVMPYAGIRQSLWYALERRPDVGWRFDCLGQITAAQLRRLGDDAVQRWRRAPVVFEFCSTVDWSTVDDAVALTHPVLVHDNGTAGQRELPDLLADIGYRYALDGAQWPRSVGPGERFTLTMWWHNDGSSLAYETLGVTPTLRAALFDGGGRIAHSWTVADTVGDWAPDSAVPVEAQLAAPGELAAGTYDLRVAIVNEQSQHPLALPMRGVTDGGWFPLGELRIVEPS